MSDIRLSPREQRVLELLAEGMRCPDVAAELHVSVSTVKNNITSLYEKLGGAHTAGHAVHLAHLAGLLGGESEDVAIARQAREMGFQLALIRAGKS